MKKFELVYHSNSPYDLFFQSYSNLPLQCSSQIKYCSFSIASKSNKTHKNLQALFHRQALN